MIGGECPDCDRRLLTDGTCACGWAPTPLPKPVSAETAGACQICHEATPERQQTPGEDGLRRCASCHVVYLRERAARDAISQEALAACRATMAGAFGRASVKWTTTRIQS